MPYLCVAGECCARDRRRARWNQLTPQAIAGGGCAVILVWGPMVFIPAAWLVHVLRG